MNKQLIDTVIKQIKTDIADGDLTAIAEMLGYLPDAVLRGYLPEADDWSVEEEQLHERRMHACDR